MFSKEFLSEIKELAIQIAKRQRGEDHMQSFKVLLQKFANEREELFEASQKWDEIPDVTYYAACLKIVFDGLSDDEKDEIIDRPHPDGKRSVRGHMDHTMVVMRGYAKIFKAYIPQLEASTLAKYRLRAV